MGNTKGGHKTIRRRKGRNTKKRKEKVSKGTPSRGGWGGLRQFLIHVCS